MSALIFNKGKLYRLAALVQVLLLISYLSLNIINVEENSVALPFLAGFLALTSSTFLFRLIQRQVIMRMHFLVFLIFFIWLIFKLVVDLQDVEYLKQVSIGTANGVFLYFMIGALLRLSFEVLVGYSSSLFLLRALMALFLLGCFVFYKAYTSLLVFDNVFYVYIDGGNYQRIGGFMIILFAFFSYCFLNLHLRAGSRLSSVYMSFIAYSLGFVFLMLSSQIIGSNAATVNLFGCYLLTVVFVFLRRKIIDHSVGCFGFFRSRVVFFELIKSSLTVSVLGFLMLSGVIYLSGFDVGNTRLFGFGTWGNDSVESRYNLLVELFISQLSYAPFFGDMNVAYITTGEKGKYIHSFIMHLISTLGFFGFIIFCCYFLAVWIKSVPLYSGGYSEKVSGSWLLIMLLLFSIFASLATSMYWIVLYFYLGFFSEPFCFKNFIFQKKSMV